MRPKVAKREPKIPRELPTAKEQSAMVSRALHKAREYYEVEPGRYPDSYDVELAMKDGLVGAKKGLRILIKKKVKPEVIHFQQGLVTGLRFATGFVGRRPGERKGGRLVTKSGKLKKQKRGSII